MVSNVASKTNYDEIKEFFSQAGKVNAVNLVTDRISRRHKGVGYIEYASTECVPLSLRLSGQKLKDLAVIVELSQTEKKRAVAMAARAQADPTQLYDTNIPESH